MSNTKDTQSIILTVGALAVSVLLWGGLLWAIAYMRTLATDTSDTALQARIEQKVKMIRSARRQITSTDNDIKRLRELFVSNESIPHLLDTIESIHSGSISPTIGTIRKSDKGEIVITTSFKGSLADVLGTIDALDAIPYVHIIRRTWVHDAGDTFEGGAHIVFYTQSI